MKRQPEVEPGDRAGGRTAATEEGPPLGVLATVGAARLADLELGEPRLVVRDAERLGARGRCLLVLLALNAPAVVVMSISGPE